jgi:hypothetical protein
LVGDVVPSTSSRAPAPKSDFSLYFWQMRRTATGISATEIMHIKTTKSGKISYAEEIPGSGS